MYTHPLLPWRLPMTTLKDTTSLTIRNTPKDLQRRLRIICLELDITYAEFLEKAAEVYEKHPSKFKQSK